MGRIIESQFEFLAGYEVEQLERIDRSGGVRVLGFPGAVAVDPQQEMADGRIIRVIPSVGQPWVGVFDDGGYGVPPAASGRLLGWPDQVSLCVVYAGGGIVVRTDAPEETFEIESFPITSVLVAAEHDVVVFSDFTTFTAYDRGGLRWREEVASDNATLLSVEGDEIAGTGSLNGVDHRSIRVKLANGHRAN
jgi:hypothetical protein